MSTPTGPKGPSDPDPEQGRTTLRPTPDVAWGGDATSGTGDLPDAASSDMAPPVPPVPPAPEEGAPRRRRRPRWLYWVIGIVVLALVAAGVLLTVKLTRGSDATRSPEAVADRFAENLAQKDVLGLAAQVSPSEYAPTAGNLVALLKDSGLDRAISGDGAKDPTATLKSLSDVLDTVDVKKSEMRTSVHQQGEHLAAVDVDSWDLDVEMDRDQLRKARTRAAREHGISTPQLSELESLGSFDDDDLSFTGEAITEDKPMRLVMVKEDSGWYLSPTLSVLETSRLRDDDDAAEPDWDVDPTGLDGRKSGPDALSSLFDTLLEVREPADLFSDDLLSNLALPERRALLLYRPLVEKATDDGGASPGNLGDIGSLLQVKWDLEEKKIKNDLSIVSMGKSSIGIPMAVTLNFDGAKITESSRRMTLDLGAGLEDPERLGFATVKDKGGWRVSLLDTLANFGSLKADDRALELAEQKWDSRVGDGEARSEHPRFEDLPELTQNYLAVTDSMSRAWSDMSHEGGSAPGSTPDPGSDSGSILGEDGILP